MDNDGVNESRRRVLGVMTAAVGGAGAVGVVVPFIGSWNPSARAKAAGAPVSVDISKIEGLLNEAGINTWADLAAADVEKLQAVLSEAGSRYAVHNPSTWAQQADLCVKQAWDELQALQDALDGGKVVS